MINTQKEFGKLPNSFCIGTLLISTPKLKILKAKTSNKQVIFPVYFYVYVYTEILALKALQLVTFFNKIITVLSEGG